MKIDQIQNSKRKVAVTKIIEKAISLGKTALTEDESKALLKLYGVPVVMEKRVDTAIQAVDVASEMGFPVVVKGLGAKLTHKSDQGLVCLNNYDGKSVTIAVEKIKEKAGKELEAILVQPQFKGRREFVAGLSYDRNFGHVVMFGVGGIFTEALNDVVFRITPLCDLDAEEMIKGIKSRKLLENFRGEKEANKDVLKKILLGLSQIAEDFDCIKEIDINPLIVSSDGEIMAVDALVILSDYNIRETFLPPVDPYALGALFYPQSVAFVGASATIGKWGHMLLTNTLSGGYEGGIYLVNPNGTKIVGKEVYKSVKDIPGKIDLAVVTIPAKFVMELIPQFKEKGIKGMLLITSGFRETGPEGRIIEDKLVKAARKAGIIILGPNTMGICNPHLKFFCCGAHVHPLPGSTALVAQSGNMGTQLLAFADQQGLGIRAFSGSGNEAMVTIEDYMESFEADALTKTVVMYIESVKNGKRFFESAKRVSRKKPVVILKGGRTDVGGRAAASHTGALASNYKVFDAACHQAGIVQAQTTMELLDLSAVFSSLPLPAGNRVAIMTLGGGWGVVSADLCAENGLFIPHLSSDIIKRFDKILPDYWSRSNPVDIVGENDINLAMNAVEELLKWDGCDAVIHLGIHGKKIFIEKMAKSVEDFDPDYSGDFIDAVKNEFIAQEEKYIEHIAKLTCKYEKPVLGVSLLTDSTTRTLYRVSGCKYKSLFFPSPERAVKALAGMYRYKKWLIDNLSL